MFVLKKDLDNAFDRICQPFIFQVMLSFGFDQGFIRWVKSYISNMWISPLVNGRATTFFQASWGLGKGCFLSLLLYAIQASMLSLQLEQANIDHDLISIRMAQGTEDVNHTQFADDIILLGGASQLIMRRFKP